MKKAPPKKQNNKNNKNNNKKIPDRYILKKSHEGNYITCLESPNIIVRIQKGKVFSESSAKRSPERTIFLDGACDSPPFLDLKRQIYNLDHHTGIIRSFTLSTCEQAAILVLKGLELVDKNWFVWANDPDLDTVLAIWVLLNHNYLFNKDEDTQINSIIPILRLEGLIDALGLELTHFSAFPKKLLEETTQKIDLLRKKEVQLKSQGKWESMDFHEYTVQILKKIDELIFHPDTFKDFKGFEELARCELDDKLSAVVYNADMGIYEIEQRLNRVYGRNPGLIILQKSPGHYTIRKSDLFTPLDMNHIYDKLNWYDKNVNGKHPNNRWGGAGEIGGSPRETGTALTPTELVEIIQETYRKPNLLERIIRISGIAFLGLGLPVLGWLLISIFKISESFYYLLLEYKGLPPLYSILIVSIYSFSVFAIIGLKKYWFFGMKYPSGKDWWLFFPGFLLGASFNGTWIPPLKEGGLDLGISLLFCLILPFFNELLFRGVIHSLLAKIFKVQVAGGDWFVSYPVIIGSVVYALTVLFFPIHSESFFGSVVGYSHYFLQGIGALVLGFFSGICRERSESILPGAAFHILSVSFIWLILFGMK